jgi:hypothetical protein
MWVSSRQKGRTYLTPMLRLFPFLFVCLLANVANAQPDTCTATTRTVQQFIGEIITFCGTPSTVFVPEPGKVKGDPVYLNFGGAFPHHTFTVLIWGDVAGKQRKKLVKRYNGKALRVKGWVKTYEDKPVIYVKELDDIEVK